MRKTWIFGVGFLLACALAFWLYRASIPEETRIRRLVEGMAAGFNRSSAGRTVAGLSDDFFDETHGAGKRELQGFLFQLFLRERDPETKEFRYRAELDDLQVDIEPDEAAARVRVLADVSRRRDDGWESIWTTRVEAELGKEDGRWRILRARYESQKGRMPWR